MRIPYFKRLTKEERSIYVNLISQMNFVKLQCWDEKAPEGFDKA